MAQCETHHLLDAMEALSMEAKGLFEQDLVLHRPLVRKRSKVRKVCQRLLDVMFVPVKHPECLEGDQCQSHDG